MQINLTPEQEQTLARLASQHGYATVEQLAATVLGVYAEQPEIIERPGPDHWAYGLTEGELTESVRRCDEGMQQFEQGLGVPIDEARQRIAEKHGFKLDS